jgi:glycosyltransferase involved in cell wall biosynthesis
MEPGLSESRDMPMEKKDSIPHISVCICTYRRLDLLKRLLEDLARQETDNRFYFSVVVADNDGDRSAEPLIREIRTKCPFEITYCVESRQNIALARNKVVENAKGDFLAFIDDDEFPSRRWLLTLFTVLIDGDVDGVLGPVLRHFDETPPRWLEKSKLYVRRVNPTGMQVEWQEARTGNVLIRRDVIGEDPAPFRPEFRAGEDQDFFRRKIAEGRKFIWCAEAEAFEVVPPSRWSRSYLLRKALLRGATAGLHTDAKGVLRSIVAVCLYTPALPFAFLFGQHRGIPLMVSLCDHLGKLLIVIGINPVRGEYVLDGPQEKAFKVEGEGTTKIPTAVG